MTRSAVRTSPSSSTGPRRTSTGLQTKMSKKVRHLVKRVLFRARKDINRTAEKQV
jgi:hypothetical protein